jgi:sugar-specific transcriptional regulator TrmB
MRYIKTYENFLIKEEKTWHWLATAAVLITNLILNKIEESGDAKKAKTEVKQMFSSAKELYYPEIDSAKKYVIDKVLNSPDIKNKEEIVNKINTIKFIESPKELGDDNPGYLRKGWGVW